MQVTTVIMLASAALAGAAGYILVPGAIGFAARVWSGLGVRSRMRGGTGPARLVLEGGIPGFGGVSGALLRLSPVRKAFQELAGVLAARGVHATADTACQVSVVLALAVFASGLLLLGSLAGAFVAVIAAAAVAAWRVRSAAMRRRAALLESLPDALRALGAYYGSGLTLQQAFEQLGSDIEAPLGPMLGDVASDVRAGIPIGDALARLRARSGMRELAFASVAIEVHQRTGGSLQQLLDRAARDVVDSLALARELEVKTAQARLSAKVVSAMPVLVLLVTALANPGYLAAFLASPVGLGMFLVACALEVAGIVSIRAILNAGSPRGRR